LFTSLGAAVGLFIGNFRIKGIGLGISGCLFSGLLLGHLGANVNSEILEFMKEFGLMLFVYCIGLQVGPGFMSTLRKQGLLFNGLAAAIVLLGVGMTLAVWKFFGVEMPVAVGMFSGATTNTPSLGAAQSILSEIFSKNDVKLGLPGLGYAVAYPFGILGTIFSMLFIKSLFKIDPKKEAALLAAEGRADFCPLGTLNLEITNPNLNGLEIEKIPGWPNLDVVV
jgi:putative transport protein